MNYRPVNFSRSVAFTRASGTTAYTAGDVVGSATAYVNPILAVVACAGGSGEINRIALVKSTNTVANATFRVHFFALPPTAVADNTAWALTYADAAKWLASVDLATMVTDGGLVGARTQDLSTRINFQLPAGATTLYAVVTALGAYAPGDSEQFRLEISVGQK